MGQFKTISMLIKSCFMFFVIVAFIENCFACHWLFNGKGLFRRRSERSVSELKDEALAELTLHAFEKCDVDGVYGISWKEVMECEEEFCEKLNILCPTQQEFQSFDQNEDGSLTLEEYFDQM